MGRAVRYIVCLGHGWPWGFLYWRFRRPYGRKLEGKEDVLGISEEERSESGKMAVHEDKSEIKEMERRKE